MIRPEEQRAESLASMLGAGAAIAIALVGFALAFGAMADQVVRP